MDHPYVPHHHLHVSTGFIFVVLLAVVAVVALIVFARRGGKPAGQGQPYRPDFQPPTTTTYAPSYPSYASGPTAPVVVNAGSSDGLLTGLVLGEMMSRPETVMAAPVYAAPAADGGFTYDSGSASSDSDAGGGVDLDW